MCLYGTIRELTFCRNLRILLFWTRYQKICPPCFDLKPSCVCLEGPCNEKEGLCTKTKRFVVTETVQSVKKSLQLS